MAFLEDLAEYLQGTDGRPHFEPADAREMLVDALERLDQQSRAASSKAPSAGTILTEWHAADRVVRFAEKLYRLLRQSMGRAERPAEIENWVAVAIERRVGVQSELASSVRTAELDRLAGLAWEATSPDWWRGSDVDVEGYANAIRATRRDGDAVAVTPIGRVFLALTGRDAVRWLLEVEVEQSIGMRDPWRISREQAQRLVETPRQTLDLGRGEQWAAGFGDTLKRLKAIGLVSVYRDDEELEETWELVPPGVALLTEIADNVESPLSTLAKTLLADLTLSAIAQTPGGRQAEETIAAEATARQARLVAHEIRNALVPVKTTLGFLYREMLIEPPSQVLHKRREAIDRGVEEIFRFVEQLVRVAALAAAPPEPFDVIPVIQDAVAAIDVRSRSKIATVLPSSLPPVTGHRSRLVMALANLLRNAFQHGGERLTQVRLSAEAVDAMRAVRLTVEDDGVGVPDALRRAIFDEGISLEPGGSGLGLALVREVVEKEMHGLVACETSSLGGARFIVQLPATGAGA